MLEPAETHVDIVFKNPPEGFKEALWELLTASVGLAIVNRMNETPGWATAGEIASDTVPVGQAPPCDSDTALRRCRKLVEMGYLEINRFAYGDVFSRNFFRPTEEGYDLTLVAWKAVGNR